ncbi:penicillin-binding protein 2 [Patescibacteria group bacterium]|nr:penicillin-binding protein 2 [Patescibacteria group bacterium]
MWRIRILFTIILIVYAVIFLRLFYWQVVAADSLRLAAEAQYYAELTLPALRGSIFASDGNPLAMNEIGHLVYAEPGKINNIPLFSRGVSGIFGRDETNLARELSQPGRVWIPLAHKVDDATAATLKALHLDGLGFENESRRYYPESSMAAQLLGFVGSDTDGKDKGYFGLEGYYDRELRGKDGELRMEKDVRGAPILIGDSERIEPQDGRDLTLWLDRTVQYIAEKRLKEGIEQYGAKSGTVTILDPKTGGVLAMASFPNYDPGNFGEYSRDVYKNPIVAGSYEPGSTFKVLVMGTAINAKLVTPDTKVPETGPVPVAGYFIRTWNNQYHGQITTTQVLEYSSNVGMVAIERLLGRDRMLSLIHAFGFGVPTGVDLEDEASPELRPDNAWADIDLATASFGQGIAVTPLQMVRAVAALANGGWLMEPHVVKTITDSRGKVIPIPPKRIRQVISTSAAHIMTEMMIAAVDKGEAKWAKPAGYRIAGKTGTAQVPVAGHYDAQKTIASFVGFAPADDPKFVMLVTLSEPTASIWGSETAAPVFFRIADDLFSYYGIPPQ